ncbi:hypothetical protein GTA09_31285 [Rhodococcus hoagii]|nr:hypothetical protein [Prescottella equi]
MHDTEFLHGRGELCGGQVSGRRSDFGVRSPGPTVTTFDQLCPARVSRADVLLDRGEAASFSLRTIVFRELRGLLVDVRDVVAVDLLVEDLELAAPVVDGRELGSRSTPSTTAYSRPVPRFSTSFAVEFVGLDDREEDAAASTSGREW